MRPRGNQALKVKRAIGIAVANVDLWTRDGILVFPDFLTNRQKLFVPVYDKANKKLPANKPIGYDLTSVGEKNFNKFVNNFLDFFEAARFYGAQNFVLGYSKNYTLRTFSIQLIRNELISPVKIGYRQTTNNRDCFVIGLVNQIKSLTEAQSTPTAATWSKHEEATRKIITIICGVLGEFGIGTLSEGGLQTVYSTKKRKYEPILKDRMFFFRGIPSDLNLVEPNRDCNLISAEAKEIYNLLCDRFVGTL